MQQKKHNARHLQNVNKNLENLKFPAITNSKQKLQPQAHIPPQAMWVLGTCTSLWGAVPTDNLPPVGDADAPVLWEPIFFISKIDAHMGEKPLWDGSWGSLVTTPGVANVQLWVPLQCFPCSSLLGMTPCSVPREDAWVAWVEWWCHGVSSGNTKVGIDCCSVPALLSDLPSFLLLQIFMPLSSFSSWFLCFQSLSRIPLLLFNELTVSRSLTWWVLGKHVLRQLCKLFSHLLQIPTLMSQQPHYTDHSGLWRDWTMQPTLKNREKYLKSICKMFLPFLPSSCIFPRLHYWKCCKANSAMSRNHLHDEPRQCKEVWPPLLSTKRQRYLQREVPLVLNL